MKNILQVTLALIAVVTTAGSPLFAFAYGQGSYYSQGYYQGYYQSYYQGYYQASYASGITDHAVYGTAGSYTFTVPTGVSSVKVLVVGGGGGGGGGAADWGGGGGGGCGGAVSGQTVTVTSGQQISVTVGAGGSGGSSSAVNGSSGSASYFGSVSAAGGAYGGSGYYGYPNYTAPAGGTGGGSGGGGGGNAYPGFYGVPGQGGTAGGQTNSNGTGGRCTGSGWGVNPSSYVTKVSYTVGSGGYAPSSYAYCGGGGGGGVVIDGSSVSGQSGLAPTSGTYGPSCSPNGGQGYGGGGGGSYYSGSPAYGGAGASGVVYIEWTPPAASCAVSLSPSTINQGQTATLSWSATNANSYVYIQSVGYVSGSSGSFSVSPSSTTDYSCYANGTGGSDGWHSASLTVRQSCSLPWGGTLTSGQSTTAYQASSVAYGSSCVGETRTCSNGTLSGSYQYGSCSVAAPVNCSLDGVTVPDGSSATFYSQQINPTGQTCAAVAQSRTCTNGTLSGSASYQYGTCSCAPIYSCSGNNVTYTDNACATTTVATCTSPYYCSPGTATCISPEPTFNAGVDSNGSALTGHLQAAPLLVPVGSASHVYWNVSNVNSCTVTENNPLISDSWTGLSGSHTTSSLFSQTIYTLHCVPLEGGTFTDETVTINTVPIFQEI